MALSGSAPHVLGNIFRTFIIAAALVGLLALCIAGIISGHGPEFGSDLPHNVNPAVACGTDETALAPCPEPLVAGTVVYLTTTPFKRCVRYKGADAQYYWEDNRGSVLTQGLRPIFDCLDTPYMTHDQALVPSAGTWELTWYLTDARGKVLYHQSRTYQIVSG